MLLEHPGPVDQLVFKDRLDNLAQQAIQDRQDRQAQEVHLDLQVLWDSKVHRVNKEQRANLDLRELLVTLARRAYKELLASLVRLEQRERWDIPDSQELRDNVVQLGPPVSAVRKDLSDQLGHKVPWDNPDLQGSPVRVERLVTRELQDKLELRDRREC